jgi:hypothetical protein
MSGGSRSAAGVGDSSFSLCGPFTGRKSVAQRIARNARITIALNGHLNSVQPSNRRTDVPQFPQNEGPVTSEPQAGQKGTWESPTTEFIRFRLRMSPRRVTCEDYCAPQAAWVELRSQSYMPPEAAHDAIPAPRVLFRARCPPAGC